MSRATIGYEADGDLQITKARKFHFRWTISRTEVDLPEYLWGTSRT